LPPRYDQALFRATHNSYSGHDRKSLTKQLDGGVRGLELDVHVDEYSRYGFRIGHGGPGHEVDRSNGNPNDSRLVSWLEEIASWSSRNGGHAPLTLLLDAKDDLTHPRSFGEGNLSALNQVLIDSFDEDQLYTAEMLGPAAWPPLDALTGKVIVVLSGERGGRLGYLRDGGLDPAVAIDDRDRVVELHASHRGQVWCWTGRHTGERVEWRRHGRQGDGRTPAVAIAGDGVVVGVHAGANQALEYRLGRLDAELEIEWGAKHAAPASNPAPEPRPNVWVDSGGEVRLTYQSLRGRRVKRGRIAARASRLEWSGDEPASPEDARHHKNHAKRGDRVVSVVSVPLDGVDGELLLYGTESVEAARIRYTQIAFVEAQWGRFAKDRPPEVPMDELQFFAAQAAPPYRDWARQRKEEGGVVRLWDYDDAQFKPGFKPNFAATNHPFAAWYDAYSKASGTVDT
jgi:hypothetical protein